MAYRAMISQQEETSVSVREAARAAAIAALAAHGNLSNTLESTGLAETGAGAAALAASYERAKEAYRVWKAASKKSVAFSSAFNEDRAPSSYHGKPGEIFGVKINGAPIDHALVKLSSERRKVKPSSKPRKERNRLLREQKAENAANASKTDNANEWWTWGRGFFNR